MIVGDTKTLAMTSFSQGPLDDHVLLLSLSAKMNEGEGNHCPKKCEHP